MTVGLVLVLACGGWRKQVKEGDHWMEAGNPSAAARSYDRAYDRRPEDPLIQLKLAQARLEADQPFKALPLAEMAYQADPRPDGARAVYIEALVRTWRIEPALELLGEAPETELLPLAADAWMARGELENAATALRGAEPSPENQAALAYVEARLGRTETLERVGAEAQDWVDVPSEAWADVGAAWFVAGQPDRAIAIGDIAVGNDQSLRLETGARAHWLEQAQQAEEAQRSELALRHSLRAAAVRVEDAELCWRLGVRFIALGELEQGVLWLERALLTPPYNAPDPTAVVASTDLSLGAEERDAIRAAIARSLADAYWKLARPEDEVRAMTALIQASHPPTADDLMRLSAAHGRAKQHLEAAQVAQRAAGMGHPRAAEQAARAYAAAGKVGTAIGWATTALESDPGNPDLALLAAELYAADGRYQAAVEVLDRGIAANPDDRRLVAAQNRILNSVP